MRQPVLMVVDMLTDFFREEPMVGRRAALVHAINEGVALFRRRAWPVFWVRQEFAPDLSDAPLLLRDERMHLTIAGTEGSRILPDLHQHPDDPVIVKKRYSPFFGTDLGERLAALDPERIVIAGIHTHACVRMTALDAYQRDYRVVIATDAVASFDDEYHRVTLRYLAELMQVQTMAEILARWQAPQA